MGLGRREATGHAVLRRPGKPGPLTPAPWAPAAASSPRSESFSPEWLPCLGLRAGQVLPKGEHPNAHRGDSFHPTVPQSTPRESSAGRGGRGTQLPGFLCRAAGQGWQRECLTGEQMAQLPRQGCGGAGWALSQAHGSPQLCDLRTAFGLPLPPFPHLKMGIIIGPKSQGSSGMKWLKTELSTHSCFHARLLSWLRGAQPDCQGPRSS